MLVLTHQIKISLNKMWYLFRGKVDYSTSVVNYRYVKLTYSSFGYCMTNNIFVFFFVLSCFVFCFCFCFCFCFVFVLFFVFVCLFVLWPFHNFYLHSRVFSRKVYNLHRAKLLAGTFVFYLSFRIFSSQKCYQNSTFVFRGKEGYSTLCSISTIVSIILNGILRKMNFM